MAEKEFVFTYKVKVEQEDGTLKEVEKSAKTLKEMKTAVQELNEQQEKVPIGGEAFKKLAKDIDKAEGSIKKAQESTMSLGDKLGNIPGPVGGAIQGLKGLNTAFKAIVANPIGLIITAVVGALTLLFKAFTSTKAGAEALDRVMTGIGAAMDVLRDRVVKVGGAIVKFFSGDFKGAFTDAKESVSGIGAEIVAEMNTAMAAKKVIQEVTDATRELSVERAKQNKEIAAAKLAINDETKSYDERVKSLDQVAEAEQKLLEQEIKLEKARLQAMETLAAQSDSDAETLDALAAQRIKLEQLEQESLGKQKEVNDQRKALNDRRIADNQRRVDEAKKAEEDLQNFRDALGLELITEERAKLERQLELQNEAKFKEIDALKTTEEEKAKLRLQVQQVSDQQLQAYDDKKNEEAKKKQEEEFQTQQAKAQELAQRRLDAKIELQAIENEQDLLQLKTLLDQKMEMELANADLTDEEKLLIQKKYNEAFIAEEQKLADAEMAIQKGKEQLALDGLELVKQIAGEETKVGKAAAIAQALINTYLGVTEVIKSKSILPEPFGSIAKIVQSGLILATGLKSVNTIRGVKSTPAFAEGGLVSGEGTSTSDSVVARVSNGESVINARSTSMFGPLLSTINQLGGGRKFNNADQTVSPGASMESAPIKAYVVSNDVSTQQQLDRQNKSRSII